MYHDIMSNEWIEKCMYNVYIYMYSEVYKCMYNVYSVEEYNGMYTVIVKPWNVKILYTWWWCLLILHDDWWYLGYTPIWWCFDNDAYLILIPYDYDAYFYLMVMLMYATLWCTLFDALLQTMIMMYRMMIMVHAYSIYSIHY